MQIVWRAVQDFSEMRRGYDSQTEETPAGVLVHIKVLKRTEGSGIKCVLQENASA